MGGGGEATNDDGPFHLRYWLQTQPRKMGMCYNHLPSSLPELAHRLHLSEGEASVIATAKDHETIDYEEYKGLLAPEYTGVGIVGMGGWRRFRRPEERKTKSSKELLQDQFKAPDEMDLKDKEEWNEFLQRIEKEGDPMALCNLGYSYFNGSRTTVGLIFEEKDIDAPAGTSTGTEIAAFVHDAKALHEEAWGPRAIDLAKDQELRVGDRILAVDGMDATDDNVYALLCADDVPGSTVTVTVQKFEDVKAHKKNPNHKSMPRIFTICRQERSAAKRDQVKRKAIDVWKKAAERGNAGASYNLGYCYTFGVVVKQDDQIASDWFAKFQRGRTAERLAFRQNQKAL